MERSMFFPLYYIYLYDYKHLFKEGLLSALPQTEKVNLLFFEGSSSQNNTIEVLWLFIQLLISQIQTSTSEPTVLLKKPIILEQRWKWRWRKVRWFRFINKPVMRCINFDIIDKASAAFRSIRISSVHFLPIAKLNYTSEQLFTIMLFI